MGRPARQSTDETLRLAVQVFWRLGYQATSMRDLCAETGLLPGSLYRVFGDKHTLFLAALDRYREAGLGQMAAELCRPGSPKAALVDWLKSFAEGCHGPRAAQGCMLLNAAGELAGSDPEVCWRVADSFERMRVLLVGALLRARQAGELSPNADVDGIAAGLVALVEGMRMLGKAQPQAKAIEPVLGQALRLLEG